MSSDVDLAGVPRPLDGDADGKTVADMGCYEFVNPNADSDGDGLSDASEVTADTDPTDAKSLLQFTGIAASSNEVLLSWQGGRMATQVLEVCTGVAATGGDWDPMVTFPPPTATTTNIAVPFGTEHNFYRLRIAP